MAILFFLNIFLYFFIQIIKLRFLSNFFKQNAFANINPFIILFIVKLPVDLFKIVVGPIFLLDDGIGNVFYNISILFTTLSISIDFILLRFAFLISKKYNFIIRGLNVRTTYSRMLIASIIFYFLFLLCFFLLANHSFGILNWVRAPRTGYQLHRTGAGQYWVFAISFLSISFTIFTFAVRKFKNLVLLLILYLYSAYLLGSKGIILDFLTFFLIVLWLRRYKRLKKIFLIVIPTAFILMIINFLSSVLGGAEINYVAILSYFDYYVNSAMYFKEYYSGGIDLFYGKIFLSDFWSLVPRSIYPSKPYVYGITHVNEHFFPGAAEETNTPAFGGPIKYFADFGIIGIVALTFFNPFKFIYYFLLYQLLKNYSFESIRNNLYRFMLFGFFTSPFFLFSLSFPLDMIFLFFISVTLYFIIKLKWVK